MEVDEKPTEDYSDIGGLDKQVGGLGGAAAGRTRVLGAAQQAAVQPHARRTGATAADPLAFPRRGARRADAHHAVAAAAAPPRSPCPPLRPQIQELREAIVLPITHRDRFVKLGIKPPKGVLLHGPPGARCRAVLRCAVPHWLPALRTAGVLRCWGTTGWCARCGCLLSCCRAQPSLPCPAPQAPARR